MAAQIVAKILQLQVSNTIDASFCCAERAVAKSTPAGYVIPALSP